MKKIALVTCYFQHNYGSQLQALATQMACDKMGWPYETIRIDGLLPEINRAKYRYFLSRILDIHTIQDKMALVRKKWAVKVNPAYAAHLRSRDALFTAFAAQQFVLSPLYRSKAELGAAAHQYGAFLVGSDQLWLPSNITADYYTLNFVPDSVRKVAYATSFGVSSLPARQAAMAQQFLPRLDAVMVRESSGQELIKHLTGREVPVVLDPTLLFTAEEWDKQLLRGTSHHQPIAEKYILCYFLGNNPGHRQFAKRLSEHTGYRIVQLPHLDEYVGSDEGFADYPLYEVDPLDFVSLIKQASCVLTDSFHCTVFSTLYQKPFFSFRRYSNDSAVSTNSRLYSLLESFGLSERLLTGQEDPSLIWPALSAPDFESVHQRIAAMRSQSLSLLQQAIAE